MEVKVSTEEAALKMLRTGKKYNPASLSKEFNISAARASSLFASLKAAFKYHTDEVTVDGTKCIKMIAIDGVKKENRSETRDLWNLALFA